MSNRIEKHPYSGACRIVLSAVYLRFLPEPILALWVRQVTHVESQE